MRCALERGPESKLNLHTAKIMGLLFFFKSSSEDMLTDFRDRGREGERGGEEH